MNDFPDLAYIYLRDEFAGILKQTDEGYIFKYDQDYLKKDNPHPISLSLPLKEDEYLSKTLFPFFDNLIPEGWLLDIALSNWKIDPNDRFKLLLLVGADLIGAISVRKERI